MAHQRLTCEPVLIGRIIVNTPSIRPGAVVVCAEPVVVDLPLPAYEVVEQWGEIQEDNLFDGYAETFEGRGPPSEMFSFDCPATLDARLSLDSMRPPHFLNFEFPVVLTPPDKGVK